MFEALDDPIPEPEPVMAPVTAAALFARLDRTTRVIIAAEIERVETIHELCLEFSAVDEDAYGEAAEKLIYRGADGTPPVAEYLSLEIGALLGISPGTAAGLIGDVLNCYYRHPMMWEAVRTGTVRWYRATQVISEVNRAGLSFDDAQLVDARITAGLSALPPGRATRLLRGLIAAADGDHRSLDHRRATALGILADPAHAFQLLNGDHVPSQGKATVVLHLTDQHLTDNTLIARLDGHGPLTRQTWIELLGHDRITIRPIIDHTAIAPVDSYEIPARIRNAITLRSPVDTFPYGTHPSRSLDLDHTIAYQHTPGAPPGQTRINNLAPLNRRAHRAKTTNRWTLTQHDGGRLEWTSPAGYHYATGPYGTLRETNVPSTAA